MPRPIPHPDLKKIFDVAVAAGIPKDAEVVVLIRQPGRGFKDFTQYVSNCTTTELQEIGIQFLRMVANEESQDDREKR